MSRKRDLAGHQQRLSEATWAVLAEAGLPGLTVRAVADRAGCTTGLLLHTFADKRALLLHARQLLHRRTGERADQAERDAADADSRLRAVLHQAVTLDRDKQEEARVWLAFAAAAVADEDLAALHRQHNQAFIERLDRLLKVARPHLTEELRHQQALALAALVEGLNVLTALDPATYDAPSQLAILTRSLDTQDASHDRQGLGSAGG